ncbi:hypothetical protein [Cupriavidus sp. AcVe19-1a]|uniref:hypothetical protein n=1 Tax=Cupriavidus sp. AcVe19-1a TaxID=2821359 RepID=UPI001FD83181|nr:hypothetical protein [Cupriavidus sp. AcVe19-1a]
MRQELAARDTELAEARAAQAVAISRANQQAARSGELWVALATAQERATLASAPKPRAARPAAKRAAKP